MRVWNFENICTVLFFFESVYIWEIYWVKTKPCLKADLFWGQKNKNDSPMYELHILVTFRIKQALKKTLNQISRGKYEILWLKRKQVMVKIIKNFCRLFLQYEYVFLYLIIVTSTVFRRRKNILHTSVSLKLTYLALLWPWKVGLGPQNLTMLSSCPNVTQIWFQYTH